MASVFKRSKKKGTPYTIQYMDAEGKRRTRAGFTDKSLSEQLAAKLEKEAQLVRLGLVNEEESRIAANQRLDINQHVTAFKKSLSQQSEKYRHNVITQVNRIIKAAGFETFNDVTPEKVHNALTKMMENPKFGRKTYNHHLSSFTCFCNWCCENDRLLRSPVASLNALNTEVDIRRKRRALSPEEVGKLVQAAKSSRKRV